MHDDFMRDWTRVAASEERVLADDYISRECICLLFYTTISLSHWLVIGRRLAKQLEGRKKMNNPIQETISELLDEPYFESDNYQIFDPSTRYLPSA
jgi:hypothetical protein